MKARRGMDHGNACSRRGILLIQSDQHTHRRSHERIPGSTCGFAVRSLCFVMNFLSNNLGGLQRGYTHLAIAPRYVFYSTEANSRAAEPRPVWTSDLRRRCHKREAAQINQTRTWHQRHQRVPSGNEVIPVGRGSCRHEFPREFPATNTRPGPAPCELQWRPAWR